MRTVMTGKKDGGTGKQKTTCRKINKGNIRLSDYIAAIIPEGSTIQFVLYEDFDHDGLNEAVIGLSRFAPLPPDSAVLIVKANGKGIEHCWLHFTDNSDLPGRAGIIDNSAAADTDGDGFPELVVSRVLSHEHDIDIHVFDWDANGVRRVWHSNRSFFHGSMEVEDIDGDEIAEIVVESGTREGSEFLALDETSYHVRDSFAYKWDGRVFTPRPYHVRMPYASYNKAVEFIRAIWLRDYGHAYKMVVMPGFLGLKGLDDSSINAFKCHIDAKVLPVLMRNLSKGKLVPTEPYDTCCQFIGAEDCFTVELARKENTLMVYGMIITKRI
jgi:hypothetical protein